MQLKLERIFLVKTIYNIFKARLKVISREKWDIVFLRENKVRTHMRVWKKDNLIPRNFLEKRK